MLSANITSFTWHLVVVEGFFRGELPSALVGRDGTVGLCTDSHQPASITQQQGCVGAVPDGFKVLHAFLKEGKTLFPHLLLCYRHRLLH